MGKYFKEDNNQRVSKASRGVDVSSLVKRLILAQLQLIQKPALHKGFGNANQTIIPGKRPLKYAKPPGPVGAILDLLAIKVPAIKNVKIFVDALNSGGFDKLLSKKLNNNLIRTTLNKQYLVTVGNKTVAEPIQLRQFLSEYNPETELLQKPYNFTDQQLTDIAKDIEALDKEAVKWRNWKLGIGLGVPALGFTGYHAATKIEEARDPDTPKDQSTVESVMAKQPKKATNPRQGK